MRSTIKEVKNHFKDAKEIISPVFGREADLTEYNLLKIIRTRDGFFVNKKDKTIDIQLFSVTNGYAKILTTKT